MEDTEFMPPPLTEEQQFISEAYLEALVGQTVIELPRDFATLHMKYKNYPAVPVRWAMGRCGEDIAAEGTTVEELAAIVKAGIDDAMRQP